MAKSGINKKVAKQAYNKVKGELQKLETHMNQFAKDVEAMNKDYWYGSSKANKWYEKVSDHYYLGKKTTANGTVANNLVQFYTGVYKTQAALYEVFHKATTKGIEF